MQVLNPIDVKVGACLRHMRFQRGLSVNALATEIAVTNDIVLEFESGQTRLSAQAMAKICRVLNVSPKDFFAWLPEPDTSDAKPARCKAAPTINKTGEPADAET